MIERPAARTTTLGPVLKAAIDRESNLERATVDVRLAEAGVLEAAGLDDWFLRATAVWSSQRLAQFDAQVDSLDIGASLSRSLSTGGSVSVSGETGFSDTVFPGGERTYNDTVTAALQQPLLRGRGKRFARAGQEQARLERDVASLNRRTMAIQVVNNVLVAYWELAMAWQNWEIQKNSLELALEQLRQTQASVNAGAVAPTEILAVERSIAARQQELLGAEVAITERSLALRVLTGMEIGPDEINLWVESSMNVAPQAFDAKALMARVFERSPELAAYRVQAQSLAVGVAVADNNLEPVLNLDVSIGPTGSGDNPGDALVNMAKFEGVTFRAGVTFEHTFGQRTAKGQRERAQELLKQQNLVESTAKARIVRDLIAAVKQAEAAQKRVEIGLRVIALAEKNVEAEEARFELGRATNFDVLQRQEELKQAQLSYARATVDYLLAVTTIDALTGDLLDKFGVTLTPM